MMGLNEGGAGCGAGVVGAEGSETPITQIFQKP